MRHDLEQLTPARVEMIGYLHCADNRLAYPLRIITTISF
jgi:hypothetical protein